MECIVKEENLVSSTSRVLYVFKHHRSFITRDFEMLSKHFPVESFYFNWKQLVKLPSKVWRSDVVFVWFVSYHAFITMLFARLFSKKVIVVTGGYDVAGEEEIGYGLMRNRFFRWMVGFVLHRAEKILAVSNFNKGEIKRYFDLDEHVEMIYNSVSADDFYPDDSIEKEPLVLTVGFIKQETVKRKGLDTFVQAAGLVSDARFVVVGNAEDDGSLAHLKSVASDNVKFAGFVSDKDLLQLYQRAKVYCQLSFYESFGMTPAEAMLCECVPVVTSRGALPEVAGDTGFFARYGDVADTANTIKKALDSDDEQGMNARKRVRELFSAENREKRLVEIVRDVL